MILRQAAEVLNNVPLPLFGKKRKRWSDPFWVLFLSIAILNQVAILSDFEFWLLQCHCDLFEELFVVPVYFLDFLTNDDRLMRVKVDASPAIVRLTIIALGMHEAHKSSLHWHGTWMAYRHVFFLEKVTDTSTTHLRCLDTEIWSLRDSEGGTPLWVLLRGARIVDGLTHGDKATILEGRWVVEGLGTYAWGLHFF